MSAVHSSAEAPSELLAKLALIRSKSFAARKPHEIAPGHFSQTLQREDVQQRLRESVHRRISPAGTRTLSSSLHENQG